MVEAKKNEQAYWRKSRSITKSLVLQLTYLKVHLRKAKKDMKTAIIYHYFELNRSYKENFVFFLNTAIFDDAYYFIYISGNCSVKLPNLSNVKYFFIENKNNDFGAVTEFAKHNDSNASACVCFC